MKTVKPASKQLFCKPQEAVTKTKSGFFIPEKNAEKPKVAEVINVGSGVKEFKQKDLVIYKSYSTNDIKLDGEEYFLVNEADVLGAIVEA